MRDIDGPSPHTHVSILVCFLSPYGSRCSFAQCTPPNHTYSSALTVSLLYPCRCFFCLFLICLLARSSALCFLWFPFPHSSPSFFPVLLMLSCSLFTFLQFSRIALKPSPSKVLFSQQVQSSLHSLAFQLIISHSSFALDALLCLHFADVDSVIVLSLAFSPSPLTSAVRPSHLSLPPLNTDPSNRILFHTFDRSRPLSSKMYYW